MQRMSVGGRQAGSCVRNISELFGLTHRTAEIRRNGGLQVSPSLNRISLQSPSSVAFSFSRRNVLSHLRYFPQSSLFFFCFLLQHAHEALLKLSSLSVFLAPSMSPIALSSGNSVPQQSYPAAAASMATSYLVRQVAGGGMQPISLPWCLSGIISYTILFDVCVCVCL